MIDHKRLPRWLWFDRAALAAGLALAATFVPLTAAAAASVTLKVEAADTLPGFHLADLSRYLALPRLADWRFEPAVDKGSSPDRVEWTFKLNPYAGGEVRSFMRPHMAERIFGVHRPITIEAQLYLNGVYQTLVEKQVVIQGGPNDPDLAEAVASLTQNLLGPSGAYRAIDTGQRPTYPGKAEGDPQLPKQGAPLSGHLARLVKAVLGFTGYADRASAAAP